MLGRQTVETRGARIRREAKESDGKQEAHELP